MLKLYKYLKPFYLMVAGVLLLIFLQALSDLYLPNLMSNIINKGIVSGDIAYIWKTGGFMLLITAVGVTCAVTSGFLSSRTAMGFGRLLRNNIFKRVESFSLHEFDKVGTATLITRTTNDINLVQMVTIMIMRMMIVVPMNGIGGIIMAYSKDKKLTLVLLVALPVLAAVIIFINSKSMPLFRLMQSKIDRINLVLRENLTGIRVIRAFNKEEHEKARFEEANADLTNNYIKVNRIMSFMMPSTMLVMNITIVAIYWFGGIRIDSGGMDIGSLMAFVQYAMQIMMSVNMLSMIFIMIPRAQAAAVRLNEVLETEPEIKDISEPKKVDSRKGRVCFSNVSFSYHGAERPAVSGITFEANPGEVTAIIGGTGSGKSTIVNLIPRFYDVDSGSIFVDGVDVREMAQEELRARIGLIPQTAVLFSGTISDNIRFGKKDASEEEIRRAADIAQATDFIMNMKDGFDTAIAQGGTNISGGQKQRLSIARAIVRKPEIYIFDDSFSALDFKTDAKLRAALKKEVADATMIIVAQRVGTVMDADRIIVLDEGRIVGIGKHHELLKTCGVYQEIVASQLTEEEIA